LDKPYIPHIAFIGAGNMASSIIGGLVRSGHPAERITAADPYPLSLEALSTIAAVKICDNNADAVANADVVVLAVKPQVMADASNSIAQAVQSTGAVTLSIAAGVTIASIQSRLGEEAAIVRCMPNTPALLGCGASALYANPRTSEKQRNYAQSILAAVGMVSWVPSEQALDAVTALSGSGPAYFFLFMEAMVEAGVDLGLDRDTASAMTAQTALGAARMATENGLELAELRRRVTSPGGTTQRAVESFQHNGLDSIVAKAMQAAADRAAEMALETG
jgi:pyrroline-5-carboxylate reductase